MSAELRKRITSVIATTQNLHEDVITEGSSFEELGIDSLDSINILFALEEEFDIVIPDDPKHIRSVSEVLEGIERLLQ